MTHHCQDLDWLLGCYPRGGPRLEVILGRFMPEDTVAWFLQRGVKLKVESDGRMFPTTNNSATIIDCLLQQAKKAKVEILTKVRADRLSQGDKGFELRTNTGPFEAKRVLLACGGASKATQWLTSLGHEVVPDIPSLFTFCCKHPVLEGLPGVSVANTALTLSTKPKFEADGPLLITHWGVSGPAVLKLSSFAARALAKCGYRATLHCDLLPEFKRGEVLERLRLDSNKQVAKRSPFPELVRRLWQRLVAQASIPATTPWSGLNQKQASRLAGLLKNLELNVDGKGVFKEEFVTAGGLPLHEIDPYTMESRKVPNLFVAGELLDVDGITGGFNFQNAWATGYIAGEGLGAS